MSIATAGAPTAWHLPNPGIETTIVYAHGETTESNAYNEQLTVHSDDQPMLLPPMGMAFRGGERDTNLSFEGAAEFLWTMFIAPLQ